MRPIKYRQWNQPTKSFHYWGYIDNDDTFTSPIHGESQEFTGLLDKQGKEIYEGDIVKIPAGYRGDYWEKVSILQVKYFADDNYEEVGLSLYLPNSIKWSDCEVIGNIYENPELLKGGK